MFLKKSNNGTALNDTTIYNPYEALFGGNDTGLGIFNDSSFGNDSSSSFMGPNSQSHETVDILRMLEFLQGGSG